MQNFLILAHWRDHAVFDQVQKFDPRVADGCGHLNDRPGLGIELDWDYVARHPYQPLHKFEFRDRYGGMASV